MTVGASEERHIILLLLCLVLGLNVGREERVENCVWDWRQWRPSGIYTSWNPCVYLPCPSSVAQVSCRVSQCPEHGAVHARPRTRLGSLPTPTPWSSRWTAVRASGSGAWPETSLLGVITLLPHFRLPDLANFSWANEPTTIQGRKIWASVAMLIQCKAPTLYMALWLSSGWCERREVKCTNSDMYPSIVRTWLFSSPRCHTKYRCYRWCPRSDPEDYTQCMAGWKAGSSLGQQSPHSSPQLPTCTLSCPSCSNYYYSGFLVTHKWIYNLIPYVSIICQSKIKTVMVTQEFRKYITSIPR